MFQKRNVFCTFLSFLYINKNVLGFFKKGLEIIPNLFTKNGL